MKSPRCALPFALGIAALLGCPPPAPAVTAALSLSALTARADRIIVSEVVEVRSERDSGRGDEVPVTLVTFRVERTLKGAGSSHVVLEFLGGRVEGDSLEIFDLPRFAVGDRDVLFLAAGGRRVSPLVGVMYGRFRLVRSGDESRERVAAYDGRPLAPSELADDASITRAPASASDRSVSLADFEKAVLARVARAADAGSPVAAARLAAGGLDPERQPNDDTAARLDVTVNLGTSPALRDGCPDWTCALASKSWFQRLSRGGSDGRNAAAPAERVLLEWGQDIFGRPLDTDTLALAMRRTTGTESRAAVVFNARLSWNAYGDTAATSASADGPLDLPAVAARELSLVAAAVGSASTDAGTESAAPASTRARSAGDRPSRAVSTTERVNAAASACGPGDAYVDPHLLVFDSPDHALMTAYQVGFFQPGAASPAQVVDVPLTAFLTRRAVDLPAWAVAAMQTSLVADIRTAGLATPLGVVYTYRVRGVWAGGTTAWSDGSQPFVRCTTSAAVAR